MDSKTGHEREQEAASGQAMEEVVRIHHLLPGRPPTLLLHNHGNQSGNTPKSVSTNNCTYTVQVMILPIKAIMYTHIARTIGCVSLLLNSQGMTFQPP